MNAVDPVNLAQKLIQCASVTPDDAGALDVVEAAVKDLGFTCQLKTFGGKDEPAVRNLYARWGTKLPNLCFAGHTDVVPPGDVSEWTTPPFDATIKDGVLLGRGAADMKSAIAAFIAASANAIRSDLVSGSVSLLITGDEEGPALHGTRKMLEWLKSQNETFNHCLVGEPSSKEDLGDTIKVGRRGSVNCWLTVFGRQGHVAYPERADNPIPALLKKLLTLSETPLDEGYEKFQPSSLQITDIHVGNPAHNVIPSRASARFNIRFNPTWTGETLVAWLRRTLDIAAKETGARYELDAVISGEAFLTTDDAFLRVLADAVEAGTGRRPEFSTGGGTSDARFIKDYAPVAEFGLVGATMHQIDERVATSDIETLAKIYEEVIARYFRAGLAA